MYSFRYKKVKDIAKLSSYKQNANFDEANLQKNIKWEFLHEIKQRKPGIISALCNVERLKIALADSKTLFNSRTELISKCGNFTKLYLKSGPYNVINVL